MILFETINTTKFLHDVKGLSADEICQRYFSNLLAVLTLMRMNFPTTSILNDDPNGWSTNHFAASMSMANFYGTVVFSPDKVSGLDVATKNTLKASTKLIHKVDRDNFHKMISGKLAPEWNFINHMLALLTVRLTIDSVRAKKIRAGLMIWNDLNDGQKQLVLNNCYYYVAQFDNRSPFLTRLRSLMTYKLIEPVLQTKDQLVAAVMKIKSVIVKEDGEVTNSGAVVNPGSVANPAPDGKTGVGDIATMEFRLFGNKIVRRVKRRFKKVKFKAPHDRFRRAKTTKNKEMK